MGDDERDPNENGAAIKPALKNEWVGIRKTIFTPIKPVLHRRTKMGAKRETFN
jgi:hypothetical protein